jgi:hypothetical protein
MGNQDKDKRATGVKLVHELMVDIMGGLIPGTLFLFSVIVCVVLPMICYYGMPAFINGVSSGAQNWYRQDWFWIVAFLSFLILSYVIGHIFYRSPIKFPDKISFRKERKKFVKRIIKENKKSIKGKKKETDNDLKTLERIKNIAELFVEEIEYLRSTLYSVIDQKELKNNKVYDWDFLDHCDKAEDYLKRILSCVEGKMCYRSKKLIYLKPEYKYDTDVLYVLFPEEGLACKDCPELLRTKTKNLLKEYENKIREKKDAAGSSLLYKLLVCYSILRVQNENGCATEERCEFPYISFFKYLLRRGETELLQYVNWSTINTRTKNKLNKLKIEIQLYAPQAHPILNKFESHIRMASSSWYVAKVTMIWIMPFMILITFIPILIKLIIYIYGNLLGKCEIKNGVPSVVNDVLYTYGYKDASDVPNLLIAFYFPLGVFLFLWMIKLRIQRFIHYQRLREIHTTLFIYSQIGELKRANQSK